MGKRKTPATSTDMGQESRKWLEGKPLADEDPAVDPTLRPRTLAEYIGQTKHKENLRVALTAAKRRGEAVDHILLCGPPGLGKTTLAHIVAQEMGVSLYATSGPIIEHKGALAALLTSKVTKGDVLFIDEIHRLSPTVEESLYPALDSLSIDVVTGEGAFSSSIQIPLQPFTLVGATTRTGLLTKPLLSRFGLTFRLDFYPEDELAEIVRRSADLLGVRIARVAATEIARRSRGTPRVANRLLRRVRDFAEVLGTGEVTREVVLSSCKRLEIDDGGLDEMDRRYLSILIDYYEGGPAGVEAIAAAMAEPRDSVEDVYEPFLIQQGYIGRTPRGRIATKRAYLALGRKPKDAAPSEQTTLFEPDTL